MLAVLLFRAGTADALALAQNCGQWSVVPSSNEGSLSQLQAVAAVSASDVWAVGYYLPSGSISDQPLIEHWNGSQWSIISNPSTGSNSGLVGVAVVSSNNVWAVGFTQGGTYSLIEHWDGSSPGQNLSSIAAISASDIWAVGYQIEHWDDSSWTIVSSLPSRNFLFGITAVASNDVWAVGYDAMGKSHSQIITEHWDGATWSAVPSPNPSQNFNYLFGVAAAGSELWAVGYSGGFTDQTLVEFY